MFDEIIVDNFAGGGGASTGIELATGRPVTIAINHDPDAILMKMDINNWVRQVDDVLSNSRSKIIRENGYGISIGLDLLLSYLKEIADRAVELQDEKLIEILIDLHVLKQED